MPPKETTRTEAKVLIQPIQEATTNASTPQDPTITWSSLYFFVFTYYISVNNFIFWCIMFWDWMYYWWYIIYRHHFCLNLAFFYSLYSLTLLFFLKHVVSPIRLRLHVTQEVPLPPYFSIALVTLRTMFSLVGGRVEEVSIVNNAKLFW